MERIEAEQFQNGKNQKKEVRYKRFSAIFSSSEEIVFKNSCLIIFSGRRKSLITY